MQINDADQKDKPAKSSWRPSDIQDGLDIRRRHLLDALDNIVAAELHGCIAVWRQHKLVDDVEQLLKKSDAELLRVLRYAE